MSEMVVAPPPPCTSIEILVHCLQPAHVIVCVGDEVDVQHLRLCGWAGLKGRGEQESPSQGQPQGTSPCGNTGPPATKSPWPVCASVFPVPRPQTHKATVDNFMAADSEETEARPRENQGTPTPALGGK